jgi:hypothetical protein
MPHEEVDGAVESRGGDMRADDDDDDGGGMAA